MGAVSSSSVAGLLLFYRATGQLPVHIISLSSRVEASTVGEAASSTIMIHTSEPCSVAGAVLDIAAPYSLTAVPIYLPLPPGIPFCFNYLPPLPENVVTAT